MEKFYETCLIIPALLLKMYTVIFVIWFGACKQKQ